MAKTTTTKTTKSVYFTFDYQDYHFTRDEAQILWDMLFANKSTYARAEEVSNREYGKRKENDDVKLLKRIIEANKQD